MKQIISGKLYNTETAKLCGSDSYSNVSDFSHWSEELYRKKTGEFFLYGEGGPNSRYYRPCGQNEWCSGEKIIPMTEAEAREWAEKHLTAEEYIEIFGEPEE